MEYSRRVYGILFFALFIEGVRGEDKALLGLIFAGVTTGLLFMVFMSLTFLLPFVKNAKEDPWREKRLKPPRYQRTDRVPKTVVELQPITPVIHEKQLENVYPNRFAVTEEQAEHDYFYNQGFVNDAPFYRMVDPRVPVDPYPTVVVTELDEDHASRHSAPYRQSGPLYQGTLPKDRDDGMRVSASNLSNAAGDKLTKEGGDGTPMTEQHSDEKELYIHLA